MTCAQTVRSTLALIATCLFALSAQAASSAGASPATASPASAIQFGGQCTERLAEGRHVMTSCAQSWT